MSTALSTHCAALDATTRYRSALNAMSPTSDNPVAQMDELGDAMARLHELAADTDVKVSRRAAVEALELAWENLPDFERALVQIAMKGMQEPATA